MTKKEEDKQAKKWIKILVKELGLPLYWLNLKGYSKYNKSDVMDIKI